MNANKKYGECEECEECYNASFIKNILKFMIIIVSLGGVTSNHAFASFSYTMCYIGNILTIILV
jgi:hypothetical protein